MAENKLTHEELEKEIKELKDTTSMQRKFLESNMMMVVARLSEICMDNNSPFQFNIEDYPN